MSWPDLTAISRLHYYPCSNSARDSRELSWDLGEERQSEAGHLYSKSKMRSDQKRTL
jgi:hypothetical protein